MNRTYKTRSATLSLVAAMTGAGVSCTPAAFLNNVASLGGNTPGSRGTVQVAFINNTDFRAIFTYGIYDQQDQDFTFDHDQTVTRQLGQFVAEPNADSPIEGRLEGNTESARITLQCGRTLDVGTSQLLNVIHDSTFSFEINETALFDGIGFSDKPLNDPDAGVPTFTIPGVTVLQGFEFACGRTPDANSPFGATAEESLVVFTFNEDPNAPNGVRVDVQVILP